MPYPTDRKYTKEHEWVQVNGNRPQRSALPTMRRTRWATLFLLNCPRLVRS